MDSVVMAQESVAKRMLLGEIRHNPGGANSVFSNRQSLLTAARESGGNVRRLRMEVKILKEILRDQKKRNGSRAASQGRLVPC